MAKIDNGASLTQARELVGSPTKVDLHKENTEANEIDSGRVEFKSDHVLELALSLKEAVDESLSDDSILDEMVLVPDSGHVEHNNHAENGHTDHCEHNDTEEDYLLVSKKEVQKKSGVVFIEGQLQKGHSYMTDIKLRQELREKLVTFFTSGDTELCFIVGVDLLADDDAEYIFPEDLYRELKQTLSFLMVVEYLGPASQTAAYHSHNVEIKVEVYGLHIGEAIVNYLKDNNDNDEEEDIMEQAHISSMPNLSFDRIWDRLVFDEDIKGDLIWIMINLLRFSKLRGDGLPDVNPLILLYGPPGTGKTSLCQGLAQKISIRLSFQYTTTLLVQVKTSTLLSKYFSESAKKVDDIFNSVDYLCKQDATRFICVLIDEVESIAACREATTANGEAQDSLRATNTLLTGLDRVRIHPNLMILCTSNMLDSLDAAFLDRCGLRLSVDSPSEAAQYTIIRGRLEGLMARGVIKPKVAIPPFRDAEKNSYDLTLSEDLPAARLLKVVKNISAGEFSGRSLTQLSEISIMRYLRDDDCDLSMAFDFMDRYIQAQQQQGKKRKREVFEDEASGEKEEVKAIKEEQED